MARRVTKTARFQLDDETARPPRSNVDRFNDLTAVRSPKDAQTGTSSEVGQPEEVRKQRATQAFLMAQLPSNRPSLVYQSGQVAQNPEVFAQEMQAQARRRSTCRRPSSIQPMGGPPGRAPPTMGAAPWRAPPAMGAGAAPWRAPPAVGAPPKRSVIRQRKLTIADVKYRQATDTRPEAVPSKSAAMRAKAKQSVSVPLETWMQVAEDLRVQQEKEADSIELSRSKSSSVSTVLLKPKTGSALFGKAEKHQKVMHFRERLKSVAVPIAEKKAVRAQYGEIDKTLLESAALEGWERKMQLFADTFKLLDIWSIHFKEIEGRFGSATASYFRFVRWLIVLNFFTFLVVILVITVPFVVAPYPADFTAQGQAGRGSSAGNESSSASLLQANQSLSGGSAYSFLEQAINCTLTYATAPSSGEKLKDLALDFALGTGWMERTSMFYGYYHNVSFGADSRFNYNMGLAYLLALGLTFLLSFLLILVNSSQSVKELVKDDQDQCTVHFTNNVLCGWDYSIFDDKSASNRKNILFQEFKADLTEQSKRLQSQTRTQGQKLMLLGVRVVVNIVVLSILCGALFLIYFSTKSLLALRDRTDKQSLLLMIQFLPSVTITILNALIPAIFNVLVEVEDYRPAFALKITLIRTVFVRLSSLGVLTLSLYYTLLWPSDRQAISCAEEGKSDSRCCGNFHWHGKGITETKGNRRDASAVQCWETYVGQQFYKLAIVDFSAIMAFTFFVEFPRKFIYDQLKERYVLVKNFGQQEFDLPKNVLEIVYTQTLSWLGTYFAPLLPLMTLSKIFIIFYIKKFTLMKNCAPPQHVYKVSKSNSFFNIILLISFILVAAIVAFLISRINPSKSCGPYRLYSVENYVVWTSLTDVITGWPHWLSSILFFFGTTAFYLPCFVVLCLLMYYYWALGLGYKRVEEILREQLKLEDRDRQFLLARVNDMIQQGFTADPMAMK